jgi:hypothetical protein
MLVGDLKAILREWAAASPGDKPLLRAINLLEGRIADHENMAIEDFLKLFRRAAPSARESAPSTPTKNPDQIAAEVVVGLRRAFNDDSSFEAEIERIEAMRAVTKPVLVKVFERLFERTDGVPKTAKRAELIRLILDERNILVSNENMGQLLGRRVVPA